MKKDIKVGDIFAIKIENSTKYYFGKVLFDVKRQYDGSGQTHNYLDWHKESVLIETYKHISNELIINNYETAIQSTFISKRDLLKQDIEIIDNVLVDPEKVSFPETLKNFENTCFFTVGELAIKSSLSTEYAYDNIKIFPTLGKTYYVEVATLDISNRRDLILEKDDIMDNYFKFSDIRSLPMVRKEIYLTINENPDLSYYELALKHGFDLKRFYK
ncbi:Imm26 family immunity protein [Chryseobacterium gregarium]|uniref:Imm26 family immunity protein n=1 Tax=Chryseobacterium gregarium TaxID=456299 RepID=UPI0004121130|nr:Imm26 family immunity protein [Chryseobacterium gregarium]